KPILPGQAVMIVRLFSGGNINYVVRLGTHPESVKEYLESLQGDNRLDASAIKNLSESSYDSAQFDADFSEKTTDDLPEGATNKYLTVLEQTKLANVPDNTNQEISDINAELASKVDSVRDILTTVSTQYTLAPEDTMKVIIHS